MNDSTKLALGGSVFIVAATAGLIALSPDAEPPPGPPRFECRELVPDHGRFVSSGEADCDLVFAMPRVKAPGCTLRPATADSIDQQWSYEVTERGLIVRGLRAGQSVDFDCSGGVP
jgi:hypothetical protein